MSNPPNIYVDTNTRPSARAHRRITFRLGERLNCFIHVQLFNENMTEPLSNTNYTIRGKNMGDSISGSTNNNGIIYHEPVPDDEYEIECSGHTEAIEAYYLEDKGDYGTSPCKVRVIGQ